MIYLHFKGIEKNCSYKLSKVNALRKEWSEACSQGEKNQKTKKSPMFSEAEGNRKAILVKAMPVVHCKTPLV